MRRVIHGSSAPVPIATVDSSQILVKSRSLGVENGVTSLPRQTDQAGNLSIFHSLGPKTLNQLLLFQSHLEPAPRLASSPGALPTVSFPDSGNPCELPFPANLGLVLGYGGQDRINHPAGWSPQV